jgi:hypothetical protein
VDLESLGVPQDEWVEVFKTLYKENVQVSTFYRDKQVTGGIVTDKETNILYYEGDSGDYTMREFDKNNNVTYLLKLMVEEMTIGRNQYLMIRVNLYTMKTLMVEYLM